MIEETEAEVSQITNLIRNEKMLDQINIKYQYSINIKCKIWYKYSILFD